MILLNAVSAILTESVGKNPLFVRNLIKEELQNYLLHFIFTSKKYNHLIFTGGTCLRKVYGLNRLSEDLDFDYISRFNREEFARDIDHHIATALQYTESSSRIAGNKNTVYFTFPILKQLQQYAGGTPEDVFVRCDFSQETAGGYALEKNSITAGTFQFLVTNYDLPTLFANKIVAFLRRVFYKGAAQKIPFKGRDVYDLYWLLELSAKSSYELRPNPERLGALLPDLSLEHVKKELQQKITIVDQNFLLQDLNPLLESRKTVELFVETYVENSAKHISFVL